MRKLILFFLCGTLGVLLSACASTGSTIYTYDSEGRVTQKTVTSESVVKTITDSTKGKTIIAWDNSWLAGISASGRDFSKYSNSGRSNTDGKNPCRSQ